MTFKHCNKGSRWWSAWVLINAFFGHAVRQSYTLYTSIQTADWTCSRRPLIQIIDNNGPQTVPWYSTNWIWQALLHSLPQIASRMTSFA